MVEKKKILKKKLIINLVFIIFISIIFFVFYLNKTQNENLKSNKKLFDLSEIQKVYFSRDSFEMLAKKINNSWTINKPISARMSLDIFEKDKLLK